MSDFAMTSFSSTSAPSNVRAPLLSRDVIFTPASVSRASASENLKSAAVNAYAVSWAIVTVLSEAVGAALSPAMTGPLTAMRSTLSSTNVIHVLPLFQKMSLPMLHPAAPPASSPLEFVASRRAPSAPRSRTTAYFVLSASVVLAGAVKLRTRSVKSDGEVSAVHELVG